MVTYATGPAPEQVLFWVRDRKPKLDKQLWVKWHISDAIKPLPHFSRFKLKQFRVEEFQGQNYLNFRDKIAFCC